MCGIIASLALSADLRLASKLKTINTTTKANGNCAPGSPGFDRGRGQLKLLQGIREISHRGPDSFGTWINQSNTIGLGHCRLSLNDLTSSGEQPLHSRDALVHVVVNGEIYDQDRLRQLCVERIGYQFRGHSDSELVLALYQVFGTPSFLDHLRGEFSFVLYDEAEEVVIAARDRYGIKPLFWTIVDAVDDASRKTMLFASEAKAFVPLGWKPEWDIESISTGSMDFDNEKTIFKDIRKLRPGHFMTISAQGIAQSQYWDMQYNHQPTVRSAEIHSAEEDQARGIEDCIVDVREKLVESVRHRLTADVPVGIYLSGGLDSAVVAGIAAHLREEQRTSTCNDPMQSGLECFCISFPGKSGFDEMDIAQRTADHLGIPITRCQIDEAALADNFEATTWHNERHCLDLGTGGKYCMSRTVREAGYKAIISGEGADEIFGGYPWLLVDSLRKPGSSSLNQGLYENVREAIVLRFRQMMGAGWDCAASPELEAELGHVYGYVASVMWGSAADILLPKFQKSLDEKLRVLIDSLPVSGRKHLVDGSWHPLHASLYVWNKTQLPNFLFVAECDRTEMAHGVEGRVPFLDHDLTDAVNGLPADLHIRYTPDSQTQVDESPWWRTSAECKIRDFREKWLLREAARPFLTDEIYQRRKHLYTAPATWPVGGPLWKRLASLVTRTNVENLGFVNWEEVEPLLNTAFGEHGSHQAFRNLISVAAWVVLSKRLSIPRVEV